MTKSARNLAPLSSMIERLLGSVDGVIAWLPLLLFAIYVWYSDRSTNEWLKTIDFMVFVGLWLLFWTGRELSVIGARLTEKLDEISEQLNQSKIEWKHSEIRDHAEEN